MTAVGNNIVGIPLAIVNEDGMLSDCENVSLVDSSVFVDYETGCKFKHLSCRFLQSIDTPMITKVSVETTISLPYEHAYYYHASFRNTTPLSEKLQRRQRMEKWSELCIWLKISQNRFKKDLMTEDLQEMK